MKSFYIILLSFITLNGFSQQEVTTVQKSSVPDSTAYFIKGKLIPNKELKLIPKDSIQSVNVIKRDTIIDNRRYKAQIFVILKTKEDQL